MKIGKILRNSKRKVIRTGSRVPPNLVPTLCVGTRRAALCAATCRDAERPNMRSAAERRNEEQWEITHFRDSLLRANVNLPSTEQDRGSQDYCSVRQDPPA